MIALHLEHPLHGQTHRIGPAPYFKIEGNSLRAGPDDREVGFYQQGAWHLGGQTFVTLTTESPATVHFEEDGTSVAGPHGPFERVKLVDGAIRTGARFTDLLAKFDEASQSWYSYADGKECPIAILSAA